MKHVIYAISLVVLILGLTGCSAIGELLEGEENTTTTEEAAAAEDTADEAAAAEDTADEAGSKVAAAGDVAAQDDTAAEDAAAEDAAAEAGAADAAAGKAGAAGDAARNAGVADDTTNDPATDDEVTAEDILPPGGGPTDVSPEISRGDGPPLGPEEGFAGADNTALGLPSTNMGSLQLNQPVSAELDTIMEAHDWTFRGEAGQVVSFRLEHGPGADTDPRLNVLSPSGELLLAADDTRGYDALILGYPLPETGSYTLKVDVFETGEYTLRVTDGSRDTPTYEAAQPGPGAADAGGFQGSLLLGQPATGHLESLSAVDDWTFTGEAGQLVTISVAAAPGEDTDPRVNVVAPDGSLLVSEDDSVGYDALISGYELPQSGEYTLQVDVFTGGDYVIEVRDGSNDPASHAPNQASPGRPSNGAAGAGNSALGLESTTMGAVQLDQPVRGELNTLSEAHDWTFAGQAGQVVTIRVSAADGADTDPRVNLLAPNGDFLIVADDTEGYNAVISGYELPETGNYTIKVDVFSGGAYAVLVTDGTGDPPSQEANQGTGSLPDFDLEGADNSALGLPATHMGTVGFGRQVSGELNTIMEAHDWTLSAEAGQVVTIRVEAAPGADTDPRVNLLSPSGDFLIAADDTEGLNAVIENYELPETGAYTIKVDVFTGGDYIILVMDARCCDG